LTVTPFANGQGDPNFGAEGDPAFALDTQSNLQCVAHALTRRWDSGEDGTGRGTPLVVQEPTAFNWQSGGDNRIGPKEGRTDALGTTQTPAVAYQCHGGNGGLTGGVPFVAEPRPDDEAKADRNASPLGFRCDCGLLYLGELSTPCPACGGFGGTATYPPGRGGCAGGWQEFLADLAAADPPPAGTHTPAVALCEGGYGLAEGAVSPALQTKGGKTGQGYQAVRAGMVVRRLTPVECCRLQGFSDDHLGLDPPLSDSARYRLLGNAVCVNVARWLGRRIALALKETTPGA
jgi:hypothetical protein